MIDVVLILVATSKLIYYAVKEETTAKGRLTETTEYLTILKSNGLRPKSMQSYTQIMYHHVIPFLVNYQMGDIDINVISQYKAYLTDKGLSIDNINRVLREFNHFLKHLNISSYVSNKKLNTYLSILTYLRTPEKEITRKGTHTLEQFNEFISTLKKPHLKLIARIIYTTGCRIGECLGLTAKSLNLQEHILTFYQIATPIKPYIQQGLKGKSTTRTVELDKTTFDMM